MFTLGVVLLVVVGGITADIALESSGLTQVTLFGNELVFEDWRLFLFGMFMGVLAVIALQLMFGGLWRDGRRRRAARLQRRELEAAGLSPVPTGPQAAIPAQNGTVGQPAAVPSPGPGRGLAAGRQTTPAAYGAPAGAVPPAGLVPPAGPVLPAGRVPTTGPVPPAGAVPGPMPATRPVAGRPAAPATSGSASVTSGSAPATRGSRSATSGSEPAANGSAPAVSAPAPMPVGSGPVGASGGAPSAPATTPVRRFRRLGAKLSGSDGSVAESGVKAPERPTSAVYPSDHPTDRVVARVRGAGDPARTGSGGPDSGRTDSVRTDTGRQDAIRE